MTSQIGGMKEEKKLWRQLCRYVGRYDGRKKDGNRDEKEVR